WRTSGSPTSPTSRAASLPGSRRASRSSPDRPRHAVQHVALEAVAGQLRVVELPLDGEADLVHHPPTRDVADGGEGHDLVEPELLEAEVERGERRLGRVAAPPVLGGEPPTDLDAATGPAR